MNIPMTIQNKEIQINLEDLEVEVQVDSEGGIEQFTVDGQKPSEIESIVIRDNMKEIGGEIAWRLHQKRQYGGGIR